MLISARCLRTCFGTGVTLFLAATAGAQTAGPLPITLPDAQARAAAASKAAELAKLNETAAKYRRQAAQADYFPKIGSSFANLHFNKFMGVRVALRDANAGLPLLKKNQSIFAVTVTQPVTPLFKVREAVRIARADERIAQAEAGAAAARKAAKVEHAYFKLLIAQRQREGAEIKVKMMASPVQVASVTPLLREPPTESRIALLEANKALAAENDRVTELTQALNVLLGLPLDTQLELIEPPPLIETIAAAEPPQQAIDNNPEVVEAQQTLAKARAASRLSKLDYVPDVAGLWGYSNQNAIPVLPRDFSFVGFVVSWNVFDFGKRERMVKERHTQVRMAEMNLDLVRAKAAASIQKSSLDLQRTRRILELTRQVASMHQGESLEARAARAQAEAEMFQADLDYRLAYAELQPVVTEPRP